MTLIVLHDLEDEKVLINTDSLNAVARRYPDETSLIKEPFTKLFFVKKEKRGMD